MSPIGAPGAAVLSSPSDSGNGGAGVDGAYQINTGKAIYTIGTGWGAGPWSRGGWGSGFTSGIGQQLRLWNQVSYGQDLLFAPRGGAIYRWTPTPTLEIALATRGELVFGTDVPSVVNKLLVSDATRIVIAFGCNDVGPYGTTPMDPMLIRWSAQEDYLDWTPQATNQAGSFRLSVGSSIIGALQTRQEILVWTDAAVYSMQYLGAPLVYGFTLLADNISIVSPNVTVTAVGAVFWMGVDKFYTYNGRVEPLSCSVREYVFKDINRDQLFQCFAGTNEGYSEIWWYYCSKNSNIIDRYVIYNYVEKAWYYGKLERTAWLDSPLRNFPQAATTNNLVVFHESSVDDGSTNPPSPISSYIESSDFDIGDGDRYGFVQRLIPDITFDGSTTPDPELPTVRFQMRPRQNPGASYRASNKPSVVAEESYAIQHTYAVQRFTEIVYTRIRGRQLAFRVESNSLGTQWQLGTPSMDIRQDGRR